MQWKYACTVDACVHTWCAYVQQGCALMMFICTRMHCMYTSTCVCWHHIICLLSFSLPHANALTRQNAQIVVVEKASGLLSVPGVNANAKDCLINRVGEFVPGVRVVHRLDRWKTCIRICVHIFKRRACMFICICGTNVFAHCLHVWKDICMCTHTCVRIARGAHVCVHVCQRYVYSMHIYVCIGACMIILPWLYDCDGWTLSLHHTIVWIWVSPRLLAQGYIGTDGFGARRGEPPNSVGKVLFLSCFACMPLSCMAGCIMARLCFLLVSICMHMHTSGIEKAHVSSFIWTWLLAWQAKRCTVTLVHLRGLSVHVEKRDTCLRTYTHACIFAHMLAGGFWEERSGQDVLGAGGGKTRQEGLDQQGGMWVRNLSVHVHT
jgi:hypothetical protein